MESAWILVNSRGKNHQKNHINMRIPCEKFQEKSWSHEVKILPCNSHVKKYNPNFSWRYSMRGSCENFSYYMRTTCDEKWDKMTQNALLFRYFFLVDLIYFLKNFLFYISIKLIYTLIIKWGKNNAPNIIWKF